MFRYGFPRAAILRELAQSVSTIGDGNVYCSDRPTALGTPGAKRFVVVRFSGSLESLSTTLCSGYVQFIVFAKDIAPGIEDTLTLQSMIDAVMAKFPMVTEGYRVTDPILMRGGDDNLGFHASIIQARIIADKSIK